MSCESFPTATEFGTFTTDSISTSFTDEVTTLPPSTTTLTSTICTTASTTNGTASDCSTTIIVSTIDGGVSTISVPVPVTFVITSSSPTATLFSTTCASSGEVLPPPPPTSSSSTPSWTPSLTLSPITSASISLSTSVNAAGSTVIVEHTSTYVIIPSSTQPAGSSSNNNVVPIAAGVGGGVGGLVVLAVIVWFCFRRGKKRDEDYNFNDIKFPPLPAHHTQMSSSDEIDGPIPDPYMYGRLNNNQTPAGGQPQQVSGLPHSVPPSKFDTSPIDRRRPSELSPTGTYGYAHGAPSSPPRPYENSSASHHRNPSAVNGMGSATPHGYFGYVDNEQVPNRLNPSVLSGMGPAGPNVYPGYPHEASSPPPTTYRTDGSNLNPSQPSNTHTPLTVANPGPDATFPRDMKDRTIYLRADTGYEIHGLPANSSPSSFGVTQPHAESSSAKLLPSPPPAQSTPPPEPVIQHQDAGAVYQSEGSTSSRRPVVQQESGDAVVQVNALRKRRNDKQSPHGADTVGGEAPPAYEE